MENDFFKYVGTLVSVMLFNIRFSGWGVGEGSVASIERMHFLFFHCIQGLCDAAESRRRYWRHFDCSSIYHV